MMDVNPHLVKNLLSKPVSGKVSDEFFSPLNMQHEKIKDVKIK